MDNNKIINLYENKEIKKLKIEQHNPNFNNHQMVCPFMSLICAPTGSGKTNFLMNLIQRFNGTFDMIYLLTEQEEPLYTWLQDKLGDKMKTCYKITDMPTLDDLKQDKDSKLIIFDDQNGNKSRRKLYNEYV